MRRPATRIAVAAAMVFTGACLFALDERGECLPLAVGQLVLACWVAWPLVWRR